MRLLAPGKAIIIGARGNLRPKPSPTAVEESPTAS